MGKCPILVECLFVLSRVHQLTQLGCCAGADRNPELLQDLFTSLSNIFKHLTKHVTPQLPSILHNTVGLRYSSAAHVRALAAESAGYLLRHSSHSGLKLGIKAILAEAALQPCHGELS